MWGDIAIAFLLAFITSFMMTPYSIKVARKVGAIDVPKDDRRMYKKPMPKLRWISCNMWICCIFFIPAYNNDNRK